jgi:U3 small nucleolar ribonucleoprotein protein LCP5
LLIFLLGQNIEGDPSIDRLIHIKTVLEKIRPIDYKLRYQIDKLVKTAVTGSGSKSSDPLTFKPNPVNLMSQMEGSSDDSDEDEEETGEKKFKKKQKSKESNVEPTVGKYVPPKTISMPYDEETAAEKEEKQKEKLRKRAYNSSMIDEWKEEFLDTPVEVTGGSRAQQIYSKAQKEREEFEENYFVRLPVTKSEKHRQKRLSTLGEKFFNNSFYIDFDKFH